MARPLRIEYPGAFYHVTSRGNEQKDVFKSRRDRERFLSYLESAVVRYGAVMHAYCLMSNHYHLLLETPEGNLSQIMRHINGAYTTYFNVKRKRAGHLFQGRYKAILVEADEYAIELSRYIHLNPVKVGMVDKPEEYEWSSYRQLIGITEPSEWFTTKFILGYFPGNKAREIYREFVNEAINQEIESPMMKVIASTVLGSPPFVVKMSQQHLGEKTADRDMPAVRVLNRPKMEDIIKTVNMEIKDEKLAKKASLYFCHRHSGASLREIGERFGLSDAAVTQASRRIRVASENDKTLRKRLDDIKVKLKLSVVET